MCVCVLDVETEKEKVYETQTEIETKRKTETDRQRQIVSTCPSIDKIYKPYNLNFPFFCLQGRNCKKLILATFHFPLSEQMRF